MSQKHSSTFMLEMDVEYMEHALPPFHPIDVEVEEMVHHVFLPRKLPQSQPRTLIKDDANLLQLMANVIEKYKHNFPDIIPNSSARLFKMWSSLQCEETLNEKRISDAIKSLEVGEMFALYIRNQNCGLILSMPMNCYKNDVIFSTFPASIPRKTLSAADIGMQFPVQSIKIPFSYILVDHSFAHQLSTLHSKDFEVVLAKLQKKEHTIQNCRDVPDPVFVSEWLAATLANHNSDLCSANDFPKVFKKVRDILLLNRSAGAQLPFRRSGFWMVIKVVLQVNLERELGAEDGRFLYKLILIEFLTTICEYKNNSSINSDLVMQMLAKVARRLEKLDSLAIKITNPSLKSVHEEIHKNSVKLINDIREKLNEQFHAVCQVDKKMSQLAPLEDLDFKNDVIQTIPSLLQYIELREGVNNSLKSAGKYTFVPMVNFHRHDRQSKEIPTVENTLSVHEFGMGFSLTDSEDFVLEHLDNNFSPVSIRDFAHSSYLPNALGYYKDDPLGGSRMILTLLWAIKVLDTIAVNAHNTLRDHHSGINAKIINQLLLPKRKDLEKAFELQQYFDERNEFSNFPSLIGENEVTQNSFSARFPETNEEMRELRNSILEDAKKEIEDKLTQVNALREQVADWQEELDGLHSCEYRLIFRHYSCGTAPHESIFLPCSDERCEASTREHIPACKKCFLKKQIGAAKVLIYEKPLSDRVHDQNAVVFELLIPVEIACLRDTLFLFSMEICKKANTYTKKDNKVTWKNCPRLPHPKTESYQHRIHLGSTRQSCRQDYVHVSVPDSSIILQNNRSHSFYGDGYLYNGKTSGIFEITRNLDEDNVKDFCTLTVDKDSPYSSLQWALAGTDHSQNDILASQGKCPQSLHLSDWKEFGTIRSGHRLQIRNLCIAMSAEKLSCKSESVVFLVAQALWETGPNDFRRWYRESHEDLLDVTFLAKMNQFLNEFLQTHRNNWKQPNYLLTIILITNRVLEMNSDENISNLFIGILLQCRDVAVDWMTTIKDVMKTSNEDTCKKLRDLIVTTAISCALTFSLDSSVESFSQIIGSPRQATIWLLALITLDNNMILGRTALDSESVTRRNFLRVIRNTGFHIVEELKSVLCSDGYAELNNFTAKQWIAAPVENTKWEHHGTTYYKSAKDNNLIDRCIQVDLIHGKFMVDGNPVARLPQTFVLHPLFDTTFGKTIFEVQPFGPNSFCTLFQYAGCKYVFQMINKKLIITEQRSNGDYYELIPHSIFEDDINYPLSQNYSHHWSKVKNTVEFRFSGSKDLKCHKETETDFEYELNLESKVLVQKSTGKMIVDVRSNSFKKISTFLRRFEKEEYIMILADTNYNATVELSRMRLHFDVTDDFRLASKEYEGMLVSLQHKVDGCLIGLENGLVLEENYQNGQQKYLLVPHGEITIEDHKIAISLDNVQKHFVYEINHQFRQIKAGKNYSAWFYLAYLHAITAHPLEDPFTGITGTERALEILQSALCWSYEPYDVESLKTMENIAKLTPTRQYFNSPSIPNIENVLWPIFMSSTAAAHELYLMIINKLIADSQKLCFLFNSKPEPLIKSETVQELNEKAYRAHSSWNPNANISEDFLSVKQQNFITIDENGYYPLRNDSFSILSDLQKSSYGSHQDAPTIRNNMRILSALEHGGIYNVPGPGVTNLILHQFLLTDPTLKGVAEIVHRIPHPDSWLPINLKETFLELYIVARNVRRGNQHSEWILFLSFLAFRGYNLGLLLILHAVSRNPTTFENQQMSTPENKNLDPPKIVSYIDPSHNTFNAGTIRGILQKCQIGADRYLSMKNSPSKSFCWEGYQKQYCSRFDAVLNQFYLQEVNIVLNLFTNQIEMIWPIDDCDSLRLETELIDIATARKEINIYLKRWNDNRKLLLFLNALSEKCDALHRMSSNLMPRPVPAIWQQPVQTLPDKIKFTIDYTEKMNTCCLRNLDLPIFWEAENIYKSGKFECPFDASIEVESLKKRYDFFVNNSQKFWKILLSSCAPNDVSHLTDSGLYPRLTPVRMLLNLIQRKRNGSNLAMNSLIGACCVLWTLEQQAGRMIKYRRNINRFENLLQRELETTAHDGWSPAKRPEWLVFELESNLMIRGVQVRVAKRMMKPPGDKHSVMQLNMGEGKTSVIVPLLCVVLADGNSMCRVTVLRSLFRTNLASLRHSIGVWLNRRVYTFPCRRDMNIGQREITQIMSVYQECLENRGVVLTRPEYLLSFQLKMYETALKADIPAATCLLKTQEWLNGTARDILDESDEILHAKYQLIYTIGSKSSVDGDDLRWTIAQNLLKRVPVKMKFLFQRFGVENIEFDDVFEQENGAEIFTPCRLLREDMYQELINELADDILEGRVTMTNCTFPDLSAEEKRVVKEFLTKRTLDEETHNATLDIFSDIPGQKDMILILAGYLKYEVLRVAFSKRWRVNYGVNPKGHLKMAVPFKAKDVATKMTEFGHPDVAICLTLLSYYYSGLSNDQLLQCFHRLERMPNAETIYEGWINEITKTNVDPSVKIYNGLPLEDRKRRDEFLFPILRKNMYVIDFWLSNNVFPSEARQFEKKMMTTAWDLVSEDKKNIVTGFSGTNDSQELLPGPIRQNDLEELNETNKNIRKILLREENDDFYALPSNVTGLKVLENLVKKSIPVLLDAGALMLELDNEQVAEKWLEMIPDSNFKIQNIEAAVYFDDNNVLMVKDRQNGVTEFELSSYRDRLDKCVVYLDDYHTRGTDLTFYTNTRACVTLGRGITRDKTVQACMRMRMLGKGHSVSFWGSQEATNGIRELCGQNEIRTKDVLQWIESNSRKFEKDGLVHWTVSGMNYAQKRASHKLLASVDVAKLSLRCSEREIIKLEEMYGRVKNEQLFTEIIGQHFSVLTQSFEDENKFGYEGIQAAKQIIWKTRNVILDRLNEHIPDVKRFAELMDEEQEKELEQDKERDDEVYRQVESAIPCKSKLDKNVELCIKHGFEHMDSQFALLWRNSVIELPVELKKYKFGSQLDSTWGAKVFATKDFISVVQNYSGYNEEFLRPLTWIVSFPSLHLLLLSPHEANAYLPIFRSDNPVSTLHMFSPRLRPKQNSLVNVPELQVPLCRSVSIDGHLQTQLSAFSGSMYFDDEQEQEEYSNFVGVIPKRRSEKHQEDFEKGLITKIGFVLPENRNSVSGAIAEKCKFQEHPDKFIRGIVKARHGFFPSTSHVSMLILEAKKTVFDEN